MKLLKIIELTLVQAVPYTSGGSTDAEANRKIITLPGNFPQKPESGTVELSVQLLGQSLSKVETVYFLGLDILSGHVTRWTEKSPGIYDLVVEFQDIYTYGLDNALKNTMLPGTLLIGLTVEECASLGTIPVQKAVLELLAGYLIPTKCAEIVQFARSGLIIQPKQNGDDRLFTVFHEEISGSDLVIPENEDGIPMLPLASLNLSDLPFLLGDSGAKNGFSFFVNAGEDEDDKRAGVVQNYDWLEDEETYDGESISWEGKLFFDIPSTEHAVVQTLHFSDDEIAQYEELFSIYKRFITGDLEDAEVNKLLGYPDSIQGCIAMEAERSSKNSEFGAVKAESAACWHLLLQVSPYCHWLNIFDEIGDATLYYMISDADWTAGDFSRVQLVAQNT